MHRTLAALALILAAFAALAALLMPGPAAHADPHTAAASAGTAHDSQPRGTAVGPDLAVLSAAAPTGELTPAQATEALLAADRVCEARTDLVPLPELSAAVAEAGGLTPADAAAFVAAALDRCPTL